MARATTLTVDVHLQPDDLSSALAQDVRRGLTASPKQLSPKWFYDERGSLLFDDITRLPEYYLTRCEREILRARSSEIAGITRATTLVELGSGTSEKTLILLDAFNDEGSLERFVPFDVSEAVLRDAAGRINSRYPELEVHAVVGDFEHHLQHLPGGDRRLIAFLGSTIGNFPPRTRAHFFASLAGTMHNDDALLVGFDLVKDVGRLEAAYNDAGGVTAEFNRNVLHVMNRELGADFDPHAFDHVARFDRDEEWMAMSLRARQAQTVTLSALGLEVGFEAGEDMQTEISAKFRLDRLGAELAGAGLAIDHWWTDDSDDFGVALIRPS